MDQFLPSHQSFAQNSTRNSKIMVSKILVEKWQKNCSVQGLEINFWIQCFYRIFWHVSRIQKSHPIWMCLIVEFKSPLSVLCKDQINFACQMVSLSYQTKNLRCCLTRRIEKKNDKDTICTLRHYSICLIVCSLWCKVHYICTHTVLHT